MIGRKKDKEAKKEIIAEAAAEPKEVFDRLWCQSGNAFLYKVLIRKNQSFARGHFLWRSVVITDDWLDAGEAFLKKPDSLERYNCDYRTLENQQEAYLPFNITRAGYFSYEAALAYAFWCETNIIGIYGDSDIRGRVEAAIATVEIKYNIDVTKCNRVMTLDGFKLAKYELLLKDWDQRKKQGISDSDA